MQALWAVLQSRVDCCLHLPRKERDPQQVPEPSPRDLCAKSSPEAVAGLKLLHAIWPNFLGLAQGDSFTDTVPALSVLA